MVFSAHGVSPAVREEARDRKLRTIDATCPLVTKVHQEAKRFAREDYDILLVGHAGHEEVEGTAGEAPAHIQLVETRGGRRRGDGARPGEGRVAVADHAERRRDDGDRAGAARAVPDAAEPAERRHLLRHPEPPGRGQGDGAAVRPRARRRVAELVELGAAGRGGAVGRRRGGVPRRLRPRDRRGVARRRADRRRHQRRVGAGGAGPGRARPPGRARLGRASRRSRPPRRRWPSRCRASCGRAAPLADLALQRQPAEAQREHDAGGDGHRREAVDQRRRDDQQRVRAVRAVPIRTIAGTATASSSGGATTGPNRLRRRTHVTARTQPQK